MENKIQKHKNTEYIAWKSKSCCQDGDAKKCEGVTHFFLKRNCTYYQSHRLHNYILYLDRNTDVIRKLEMLNMKHIRTHFEV